MGLMWVVVTSPSRNYGRVGRVERSDYVRLHKVRVQFGADGPWASIVRSNLLPLAPLVRMIEEATGCRYDAGSDG